MVNYFEIAEDEKPTDLGSSRIVGKNYPGWGTLLPRSYETGKIIKNINNEGQRHEDNQILSQF